MVAAAAKAEEKEAFAQLAHAKASGDSMQVELAELEYKRKYAQSHDAAEAVKAAKAHRHSHAEEQAARPKQTTRQQDESTTAWSQLLQSLPKRTKIKVLTKNAFRKVVHEIHSEKLKSTGSDQVPESIFIQEFFQKRYGLEDIADTYLFGFLCSLQKYTPKEMGLENPGVVYYLNRLRAEIDDALQTRKCVIMPVVE